jgi:hypothetical protein
MLVMAFAPHGELLGYLLRLKETVPESETSEVDDLTSTLRVF